MSFWDDLQAWTQAQYEALMAANAKRRKKWTAEEINRLLRDRIAKRLKAKQGRAIGAEFRRRPGRRSVLPEFLCPTLSGWADYIGNVAGKFSRLFLRSTENVYGPAWVDSSGMVDQIAEASSPCNASIVLHDSVVGNKGSQYTGRMREVVQVLGGRNYRIPYNYQWCESHGIFVNQVSGAWWVIEAKSGSGVRAWRLRSCAPLTEEDQARLGVTIPFIPAGDQLPDSGNTVLLLSSEDLADAYADALPFYTEHGWAFSYDGSEACLIAITWPDTYQVSTVWKLEIAADGNGDPISAALTEVESDSLWIPHAWAPKYPHFTTNGPTLLSYDSTYGEASGPATNNAPLDVFYRPDSNNPVIIRHDSLPAVATSTESATWPLPSGTYCTGRIAAEEANGTYHTGDKDTTLYETPEINFGALGRPIGVQQKESAVYDGAVYHVATEPKDGAAWGYKLVGLTWIYDAAVTQTSIEYYGGSTTQQLYNEIFFKPLLDREIVGLYSQQKKTGDYGQRYDSHTDFLTGGFYGPNGVTISPSSYYPTLGCGDLDVALIFSAFGSDCPNAQNWQYTSIGNTLFKPMAAPHELSQQPTFTLIPDGCYPGADRPCLWAGCDIGGSFDVSCQGESGPAETSEETDLSTDVFLFDNKNGGWVQVYAEEEFDSMDDFTSYIDAEDVALGGTVPFWAHLDVFTWQGMSTRFINQNDPADMHFWGTASALYPLSESGPSEDLGWVGIPLPPDSD